MRTVRIAMYLIATVTLSAAASENPEPTGTAAKPPTLTFHRKWEPSERAFTFLIPADEADQWKPVFDIIRQGVEFNPQWIAAAARAAGQRGKTVEETMKAIQTIDQQIYENRARTNADIQHENYLLLTGQDEYVNPFTNKVERDTNEYKRRWTTDQGDRIYTDQEDFNPNAVKELNHQTWKLTPVRPR